MPTNDDQWNSVTTSIILPAIARTVWIAEPGSHTTEKFLIPAQPFNKTIKLGSTIALAAGRGAVAVRIFAADASSQGGSAEVGSSAGSASLYLAGDDRGMPLGAIRLAAYHYRGHYVPPDPATAAGKNDTHLRFGALIKAAAVPPLTHAAAAEETGAALQATAVAELIKSVVSAEITSTTKSDQHGSMLWLVSARVDPTEPALVGGSAVASASQTVGLAVDRNLTCSESSTADKNQSSEWNTMSLIMRHSRRRLFALRQYGTRLSVHVH